jgi:Subtilase family/Secretion system C-terminal sorting domain/Fibronectin type III domain
MKFTLSILVFLLSALVSGIDAQTQRSSNLGPPPPPQLYPDSVEAIVVFPQFTNDAIITASRTRVFARQVDYMPTLNAYLWRMRTGIIRIDNVSYSINTSSNMIGAISSAGTLMRPAAFSSNRNTILNDITKIKMPFDSVELLPFVGMNRTAAQSDPNLQNCSINPVSIFILDSGNQGGNDVNSISEPLIKTHLNLAKAKCFITDTNNPVDSVGLSEGKGHGTGIIYIVAAMLNDLRNNGFIVPPRTITSVKVLNADGKGSYWQYLKGFAYALDNGAQVINSSVLIKDTTDIGAITPIDKAISYAQSRGIMVVTGAGNDQTNVKNSTAVIDGNIKTLRFLPADITNDHLITVSASIHSTASTNPNTLSGRSNYGQTGSLMAAPGEGINTMGLNGNIMQRTGTSFATPFVTAAYAVLKYMSPMSAPTSLKNIILQTTDFKEVFRATPKQCDFGVLNMAAACQLLKDGICPRPLTPSVSSKNSNAAVIQWTDLGSGSGYVVQYKRATDSWLTVTTLNFLNSTASLTGLTASTNYVVRVRSNCSDFDGGACIINYSPELPFTTWAVPSCPTPTTPSVLDVTTGSANVSWVTVAGVQSYNLEYKTAASASNAWKIITGITTTNRVITGLLSNTSYDIRIKAICSATLLNTVSATVNFTTSALPCTDIEPNETNATAKKIALNTDTKAKIATAADVDWYRVTTTDGILIVTLRDLPANYNLYLYDASNVLKAASTQLGNANETLQWQVSVGNYYIKVVGVLGSFNANNCYILRANMANGDIFDAGIMQLRSQTSNSSTSNTLVDPLSKTGLDMTVFPNPTTTDQFSININSDEIGQASLTIFDMMGRAVWVNQELMLERGQTLQPIDFSKQNNGLYMVQIIKGTTIKTHKLFLGR